MGGAPSGHGRGGKAPRVPHPSGIRRSPTTHGRRGSEGERALAPRYLVTIEARTVATDRGDIGPPRSGARQVDERRRGEGVLLPGTRRATRATGPGDHTERTRTERGARRPRGPQENGGGRGAGPGDRCKGDRRRPEGSRPREGVPRRSRKDDREHGEPRPRTRGPRRRTEGARLDAREARHRVEQDHPGNRKAQGGTRSARQRTQGREGPPRRGLAAGRRGAESPGEVQG